MIRTFALAALIALPGLASAQTPVAEGTDAPDEPAQVSPFEMLPARPPASTVAFSAPASKSLLERPAKPDLPFGFDALQQDAAIKRGARDAELMEGPMNGQWRLVDASGRQLYAFQLTSSASRGEPLSGAWRNLGVARSPTSSGFIALLGYTGARLDLRFIERSPQDLVLVSVDRNAGGQFTGSLTKDGVTTPVRLERQP